MLGKLFTIKLVTDKERTWVIKFSNIIRNLSFKNYNMISEIEKLYIKTFGENKSEWVLAYGYLISTLKWSTLLILMRCWSRRIWEILCSCYKKMNALIGDHHYKMLQAKATFVMQKEIYKSF